MKVTLAVVPPGELHLLGVQAPVSVDQALDEDLLQPGALVGRYVGGVRKRRRVIDIEIGRGDVHVAGDQPQRRPHGARPPGHGLQERELARELRTFQVAAVGYVHTGEADHGNARLAPPALGRDRLTGNPQPGLAERQPGSSQQRDPGPLPGGVMDRGVAGLRQLVLGKGPWRALGLLQADDVRAVLGEQLQHARQAGAQRVDIPGDDAHRTHLRRSSWPVPPDKLGRYRAKRDFQSTSEPAGSARALRPTRPAARFVVQEHHATRLHWDLRLEHDGVLASWAIPNGIPPDPSENRLAVHTEDHPLEYLEFEGEIPAGEYGAGTMRIWDHGTFELHKWEPRKVEVSFHGERLTGRYGLFPIGSQPDGKGQDWMIHRMGPRADRERRPMPEHLVPMLAGAGELPSPESGWAFEVKWDGVRAIAYVKPGRLRLESRNLREITDGYPELRGLLGQLGMRDAVLDGEIVAFDDDGRPSFERLQRRMHVTAASAVRRLAASTPVVYAIFDLLYLDGHPLLELPYHERRSRLEALELGGPARRGPAAHRGNGARLLEATRAQRLEGIVAKRLDSRYEPGRRTGAWVKVKHTLRQELVISVWLPGEGRRTDRIGALLMGHYQDGAFRYAGRVGTGFTDQTLTALATRLAPLRTDANPFVAAPKLPRNAVFVTPKLVAEIELREWTSEGVMRAPSYKGLREDKAAEDVVLEGAAAKPPARRAAKPPARRGAGPNARVAEEHTSELQS